MKIAVHMRTCKCALIVIRMKCIAGGSLTTHQISALRVHPFPRNEEVVLKRACRCTPPMICVNRIASSLLTTQQISAPWVQTFRRYGKGARICSRAVYSTHTFYKKKTANGSLTTHQISAKSVQPFPRYGKGVHMHVRTCGRACAPYPWPG